jgi:hypothetical protein
VILKFAFALAPAITEYKACSGKGKQYQGLLLQQASLKIIPKSRELFGDLERLDASSS